MSAKETPALGALTTVGHGMAITGARRIAGSGERSDDIHGTAATMTTKNRSLLVW
jgi:hypothetical protein